MLRPRRPVRPALVLYALLLAPAARAAVPAPGVPAPLATHEVAGIPPRPAGAPTGSELVARLAGADPAERSRMLVAELLRGNVPAFLRRLTPVALHAPGAAARRASIAVMPDYLAVGSDADYLRVPLGLDDALAVARRFGLSLPTRRIVDDIYREADRKLVPAPLPPGPAMTSVAWLARHERTIAAALAGTVPGALVAGNKKDLVLTRRLWSRPGRVAIYGWHRPDGRPIQPLSTVHGARYADYSHGVRLVSRTVLVDGAPRALGDLLADPELAPLVSDEGPIPQARGLLGPPRS